MQPVPRIGRILDLVGLVLFLGGGLVYARAWTGFRSVPDFERPEHGTVMAATEFADGFRAMERWGVAVMIVGVGVFVTAWWVARRRLGSVGTVPQAAPEEGHGRNDDPLHEQGRGA